MIKKIKELDDLFDGFCNEKMTPINKLDKDEIRQLIDCNLVKILNLNVDDKKNQMLEI